MFRMNQVLVNGCMVWQLIGGVALSQTVEGELLRGQGAFLRGAGWYNLRTAQANSVNVDATIRWKADLRKIQQEKRDWEAQKGYEKKRNVEELKREMVKREQELRTNPTSKDVMSGAALNALVYDLTDPDLDSSRWRSVSGVPLPAGTSVKALLFSFTPPSASTQASAALSRGVIALSRLDIKDNWPVLLKKDQLSKERKDYEDAYNRVKDRVLRGDYAVDEILALDSALDNLKRKITTEIPAERGFLAEALKFADDLRDATRMFDARSVDYAREILIDTREHDAATVEELVAFMTKYRLQFANSERSPAARELYGQIYECLRQQFVAFNIKPGTPVTNSNPSNGGSWSSLFNGRDLSGWFVESGPSDRWKVENGILNVQGESPTSFLLTDREYSDFVLRLEFSLDAKVTSGVALRAIQGEKPVGPKGKAEVPRHPIFVLSNASDRVTTDALRWLTGPDAKEPTKAAALKPPGQWNRLQIEMRGPTLRAMVNDDEVRNVSLAKGSKYADGTIAGLARSKGRIGLQSLQGNLRFRNVEIMELAPSK